MSRLDRMAAVMVSHYFESHRGGVEIVAGRLARDIQTRGVAMSWLATGSMEGITDIGCAQLPASNVLETRLGLPYPLLFPSAILRLARAIRAADVVLIHDGIYLTSLAAFLTARFCGKPILVIQHIGEVPYANPVLRALMRLANAFLTKPLLARADRVVFISRITQGFFGKISFRHPPGFIVNGVDTQMFAPTGERATLRKRLGLPQNCSVALFVGRFVDKKGLPLLRALARRRPDVTFAFAGWGHLDPDTWGLANVRTFRGLSGHALADLYRACDVLVLPSVGEGFPLVLQEALASGLPCICGEDTARADPDAASYLTPVHIDFAEPETTAAALDAALSEKLVANVDRDRLHDFARNHYSWSQAAERYVTILREITGRS